MPQVDVVGGVGHHRPGREARHGPDRKRSTALAHVHRGRGPDRANAGDGLEHAHGDQAGLRVLLGDLESLDAVGRRRLGTLESQSGTERGSVVAVAVVAAAVGRGQHLDERLERHSAIALAERKAGFSDRHEPHGRVDVVLEEEADEVVAPLQREAGGGVDNGHESVPAGGEVGFASDCTADAVVFGSGSIHGSPVAARERASCS
ncbi:hypothetical protein [Frondihabitans sucicola]|uniref:hypothetical protein n=1 Tax=Frondihabitans sucicola TaxID=1268041 RepID=UPI002572235E|nr:hypothetical protein [Frondihabitans sucicola]